MSENLRASAEKLAARPYSVRLLIEASEEEQPLYLAMNPELDGCMAQGETVEEAVNNLAEFRVDYIEHLLEHNLLVPFPATEVWVSHDSTHGQAINFRGFFTFSSTDEKIAEVVQSENLKHLTAKRA